MRLKSLYIKDYKNIKEQTFDFSDNTGYIALIGLNGSGKSNLLEAISIIFNGLMNNKAIPFKYEIQYELEGNTYLRKPYVSMRNGSKVKDSEMIYPSSVISCYSGEDLRLWHMAFEDYYMHYFNQAISNKSFTPLLVYINKYCWKIAFIALFCSEKDETKEFLRKCLHIDDLTSINCQFIIDKEKKESFKQHNALKWFNRIEELQDKDKKRVINANTMRTIDMSLYGVTLPEKNSQYIFQYLFLLSLPKKNPQKRQNVDKLIEEIKIDINGVDFDGLSEGEKKMILIECITQILGDEKSIVLLDEPDAHTHVAMKKELLKSISQYSGQIIMTTHSPMFLNKRWDGYSDHNIFYMHDGKIENSDLLKHLRELTDNEVDFFEGAFILSSKKILVVEGKYDDKYIKKAISIFAKKDKKYNKLSDIAIFSANSASAAETIYNQILHPCNERIEKVVFLFDYDDGGWKDGWKKIKAIHDINPKIIPLFYQDSYSSTSYPTSDIDVEHTNGSKCIKNENSFMVEDLFSESSYLNIISPVITSRTHKDFRKLTFGKKGTAGAIKNHIEKNYNTFDDAWYDGFKPVLDKLLDEFDL